MSRRTLPLLTFKSRSGEVVMMKNVRASIFVASEMLVQFQLHGKSMARRLRLRSAFEHLSENEMPSTRQPSQAMDWKLQ